MLESEHKAQVSHAAWAPKSAGRGGGLTHVLRCAQDLPDFCNIVHVAGQAKVHNANVSQRSGTGQQDVLGLERKEIRRVIPDKCLVARHR